MEKSIKNLICYAFFTKAFTTGPEVKYVPKIIGMDEVNRP